MRSRFNFDDVEVEYRRLRPKKASHRRYDRPYFLDTDEIVIDTRNAEIVVMRGVSEIGRFNAKDAPDCIIHRIFAERRLLKSFHDDFVRAMNLVDDSEESELDDVKDPEGEDVVDSGEIDGEFFQVKALLV